MERKYVTIKDNEYSCDIGITTEEWKEILQDKHLLGNNCKEWLIRFYDEPEHKATCKAIGEKYGVSPQSPNGSITNFAKAVQKKLNRFEIIGTDGQPRFWIIVMNGRNLSNGLFEWTLRPELVTAIENMKEIQETRFTWIPFYTEMANKLLTYKDKRNELSNIVFDLPQEFISYLSDDKKDEIDPFSVFAIFNRQINDEKRISIINHFKETLDIKAETPKDFYGIPIFNNQKSYFVWRVLDQESKREENNRLWDLFKSVILKQPDISSLFDKTLGQRGVKWNLAIALFWVSPYNYMPLDQNSRNYLSEYKLIVFKEKDLNYKNYQDLLRLINQKIENKEIKEDSYPEISYSAWKNDKSTTEDSEMMETYINLLESNHNLILTGAPGTGKTYLAKQIAESMGVESAFVQFHPSYDYTDFVEGLRPEDDGDGNIVFRRKDGVFKEFCKRALKRTKNNFEDTYNHFISDISEEDKLILNTPSGKEFAVSVNSKKNLTLYTGKELKQNGTLTKDNLSLQIDGYNEFSRLGYFYGVKKYLIDNYNLEIKQNDDIHKPFIFIIDEINRGEISKIFGELFYSIDSGYRGEKGRVMTQYQNLVEDGDEFKSGFFVPENVYIIGTMNDIDRSVESMDFAMRRRFAFKEVTAGESAENMKLPDESKERMNRLNNAISETEGLNSAYHIGASYFQNCSNFEDLWNLKLTGLLKEYLRGIDNDGEKYAKLKVAYFEEE